MIHWSAATGKKFWKLASPKPPPLATAPLRPTAVTPGVMEGKMAPTLASYAPRDASTRCCAFWMSRLRAIATRATVGKSTASIWRYIVGICAGSTLSVAVG
jgi:hypothetical protein